MKFREKTIAVFSLFFLEPLHKPVSPMDSKWVEVLMIDPSEKYASVVSYK